MESVVCTSNRSTMSFFEELKRRNVIRVGIDKLIVSWIVLQVVDIVLPMLALPESAGRCLSSTINSTQILMRCMRTQQ